MIQDKEYIDFSWKLHGKKAFTPTVAQMELTYRCPLHCKHCYTNCYNNKKHWKKELSTKKVKEIMDKCKKAGVIWFCFTGGDPLMRDDFLELYDYAKELGFITTVFSSLIPINDKILEKFIEKPPFNVETTLNAADKETYKKITGKDIFEKHISNIKKLIDSKIKLDIKTMVTKQNVDKIDDIKNFIESLGKKFKPSTTLFARLNHDKTPCYLRISPKKVVELAKKYGNFDEENIGDEKSDKIEKEPTGKLFNCSIGLNDFQINPEGIMFLCNCIRENGYDLMKKGATVEKGFRKLNGNPPLIKTKFKTDSKCKNCKYRHLCRWCPGRAFLEHKDKEAPIDYFCKVVEEFKNSQKNLNS